MSRRLGSLFLTAAFGPLHYAGQCIMARRVDEGLRQLEGNDLLLAFHHGLRAVAKEAGVAVAVVTALVPLGELEALAGRIDEHQRLAREQWQLHAGDTGLLLGVADLTVDGRAPDASLCLLRLSAKMKLDKALATPLRSLAEDIERWQQLLDASRVLIDDGETLRRAHRQRRMMRLGILLAALLGVSAASVWLARVGIARSRIDAILGAGDPCLPVDASDRAKASSQQRAALAQMADDCVAQEAADRAREQAERRRAEEARAAEAERVAREQSCARMAEATSGAANHEGLDPELVRWVTRLTRRALEPADLELAAAKMPCAGSGASPRIARAYVAAAMDSLGAWMYAAQLSDGAIEMFGAGKEALAEETRINFAGHAELYAKHALMTGKADKVRRARGLCRAAEAIEQPARQYCRAVVVAPTFAEAPSAAESP